MTPPLDPQVRELIAAASRADWQQVVMNGGPPCFHLDGGKFCLRAARWDGHHGNADHAFVGLSALLDAHLATPVPAHEHVRHVLAGLQQDKADIATQICGEMVDGGSDEFVTFDDAQRRYVAQALDDAVQECINRVATVLRSRPVPQPDDEQRAARLYEELGGDLCLCQRADVPCWCETCQWNIRRIASELAASHPDGEARRTQGDLLPLRKEIAEMTEVEAKEMLQMLTSSKSPCGHYSAYAHSPDGAGKRVVCLLCEFAPPVDGEARPQENEPCDCCRGDARGNGMHPDRCSPGCRCYGRCEDPECCSPDEVAASPGDGVAPPQGIE